VRAGAAEIGGDDRILLRAPLQLHRVCLLGNRHHLSAARVAMHQGRDARLLRSLCQIAGGKQGIVGAAEGLGLGGEGGAQPLRFPRVQHIQQADAVMESRLEDKIIGLEEDRPVALVHQRNEVRDQVRPRHAVKNGHVAISGRSVDLQVILFEQEALYACKRQLLLVMDAAIAPGVAGHAADKEHILQRKRLWKRKRRWE